MCEQRWNNFTYSCGHIVLERGDLNYCERLGNITESNPSGGCDEWNEYIDDDSLDWPCHICRVDEDDNKDEE